MYIELGQIKTNHDVESFALRLEPAYKAAKWEWTLIGYPSAGELAGRIRMLIGYESEIADTGGVRIKRRGDGAFLQVDKKLQQLL